MSVRRPTARKQISEIFTNYNGMRFMICKEYIVPKAKMYSTRKRLLAGKLNIPVFNNPKNKTILITCKEDKILDFCLL